MRRLLLLLPVALALVPAGESAQPRDAPAAPTKLRVAAVQMRSSRDLDANVSKIKEWLKRCADDGVQVAVFPECALTGYHDDVTKRTADELAAAEKQIAAACKEHKLYAVVGTPVREGTKLYNSAVVFSPDGKIVERYHKVQLAERWPDPGDHLSVFTVHGVKCSIIVCHDERYPELVRLPVLAGARLVFYVSHESPLTQEHKVGPYRAQIQARAVENTVFVVHANAPANTDSTGSHGHSRVIAPDGNILGEATIFKEEMVVRTIDPRLATGNNAKGSMTRGPLTDWWKEGLKHVRVID